MARCPSCLKFAAYDVSANEPEADLQFENEAITGSVHCVLSSECCGDELKSADFDIDHSITLEDIISRLKATAAEKEITLPEGFESWTFEDHLSTDESVEFSGEITERRETTKTTAKGVVKTIPPRYQKTFYGFEGMAEFTVTAKWQVLKDTDKTLEIKTLDVKIEESISDEMQASSWDEMN